MPGGKAVTRVKARLFVKNGFDILSCSACKANGNHIPDPSASEQCEDQRDF